MKKILMLLSILVIGLIGTAQTYAWETHTEDMQDSTILYSNDFDLTTDISTDLNSFMIEYNNMNNNSVVLLTVNTEVQADDLTIPIGAYQINDYNKEDTLHKIDITDGGVWYEESNGNSYIDDGLTQKIITQGNVTIEIYNNYIVEKTDFEVTGTDGWEYIIEQTNHLISDEVSTQLWFKLSPDTYYIDQFKLQVYMRYGSSTNDISLVETIDLTTAFQDGYVNSYQGSKFYVTVPTDDNGYPVEFKLTISDTDQQRYGASFGETVLDTLYMGFDEPNMREPLPTITGDSSYTFDVNHEQLTIDEIKANLSASDVTDGDISADITVKEDNYTNNEDVIGDHTIIFEVTDSDGNTSEYTVTITLYLDQPPLITHSSRIVSTVEYQAMTESEITEFLQNLN